MPLRTNLRLVAGTAFQPSPKPIEFDRSWNGTIWPVHIAELRLADTPDRAARLASARTVANDALSKMRMAARQRERRDDDRAEFFDGWAEQKIATAFVMLGHLLGIRHPEKLFDEREGRAD